MDNLKQPYRDVEQETKKTLRDIDGDDLGDDIGNAGDEVRKDLGNAGDTARRETERTIDDVGRPDPADRPRSTVPATNER